LIPPSRSSNEERGCSRSRNTALCPRISTVRTSKFFEQKCHLCVFSLDSYELAEQNKLYKLHRLCGSIEREMATWHAAAASDGYVTKRSSLNFTSSTYRIVVVFKLNIRQFVSITVNYRPHLIHVVIIKTFHGWILVNVIKIRRGQKLKRHSAMQPFSYTLPGYW
jgi:hypothetical protein